MTDLVIENRAARLDIEVTRELSITSPINEVFDFVAVQGVFPKILTGYDFCPP
jgi:hypothetical protein